MESSSLIDFEIHDKFAEGAYAVVVRADHRTTQSSYAMKFFGYKEGYPKDDWILREADYLKSLRGLCGAVQLEAVFNDSKTGALPTIPKLHLMRYPVIAIEKLYGGSLSQYLNIKAARDEKVAEKEAALIFRNTIVALHEIHVRAKLVHCKLEPLNVFFSAMNEEFPTKIVDFGFSVALYNRDEHYSYDSESCPRVLDEFNPEFLAPETIFESERSGGAVFSRATDIWQTGCILFMMLHENVHPFGNHPERIKRGHFEVKPSLSPQAQDLIKKILIVNPVERLDSFGILAHDWFKINDIDVRAALIEEPPRLSFDDFEVTSKLGDGSYGVVMNAIRKSDGLEVAMKFFGYTKLVPDTYWILREIHTLQGLVDINGVARLITTFNDSREGLLKVSHGLRKRHDRIYPVIVMEKLSGGDLFDRIMREKFSEQDASKVFRNFIVALNEVHEKADMIIGDIKLENLCLLDSSDRFPIKIIDFGMSFPLLSRQEHFDARKLGTACYLAPETLKSLKESRPSEAVYSRATDIFQAGVVLYLILHSQYPFGITGDKLLDRRIMACCYRCADTLSPEAKDLIHRIFVADPAQRITGPEILVHPWIVNNATLSTDDLGPEYRQNIRNWANFRSFKRFLEQNKGDIDRKRDLMQAAFLSQSNSPRTASTDSEEAGSGPAATPSSPDKYLSPTSDPWGGSYSISIDQVRTLRDSFCSKLGVPTLLGLLDSTRISRSPTADSTEVDDSIVGGSGGGSGGEDEVGHTHRNPLSMSAKTLGHEGIPFAQFCSILRDVQMDFLASEEVFNVFDWNSDGYVDYKEFLFTLCSVCPHDTPEETARLYFEVFDIDGSGTICKDELTHVMTQLLGGDVAACDPAIHTLYDTIDVNKDGDVSFEEFKHFYEMALQASTMSIAVSRV